jgi:two-component system sensor histidine kinase KdpD
MYIGAAPGVGKTYTMLREGGDLRRKGLDVIVGLLETHGRAETQSQVGELEVMPRKTKQYRGTRLEEMDTDEILRRKPDVVLVDELAHTNVPGSRNKKRYEDVLDILSAGISVITTVNVQHLESLNDAVLQVTGVRVRETVPDRILQLADEVQLIDVTPETLQQRMREGKIYASENIQQALGSFFKTGNLIALRELALREIADDVDERLESLERSASLRGPWRREEVIYVLVGSGPESERIIRRGFRIAYRLKAAWYVTPLPDRSEDGKLSMPARRDPFQAMTERLGGIFRPLELQGKQVYDLPAILIAAADEVKSTQLIIAQPPGNGFPGSSQMRFAKQLLRRARHMDVLVISDGGR